MVRRALVALGAFAALALSEPGAPARRAVLETPAAEETEAEAGSLDLDLGVGINAILPTDPPTEDGGYDEGGDYDDGYDEGGDYTGDPGYSESPPAVTVT